MDEVTHGLTESNELCLKGGGLQFLSAIWTPRVVADSRLVEAGRVLFANGHVLGLVHQLESSKDLQNWHHRADQG
jgi:hypothetical protein